MRGKNTTTPNTNIRLFFIDAAFLAMTTFAMTANAQVNQQGQTELSAPLEPLRLGVTSSQIFDELLAHNALRAATLLNYTAFRTYQVVDAKGKVHAEEIGQMEYRAPDQKRFVVTSEKGSAPAKASLCNTEISRVEEASFRERCLAVRSVAPVRSRLALDPDLRESPAPRRHRLAVR